MVEGVVEHLPRVVQLGFTILVGIIDAPIDDPEFLGIQIDVYAIDHANALDHPMLIATILAANPVYFE